MKNFRENISQFLVKQNNVCYQAILFRQSRDFFAVYFAAALVMLFAPPHRVMLRSSFHTRQPLDLLACQSGIYRFDLWRCFAAADSHPDHFSSLPQNTDCPVASRLVSTDQIAQRLASI
ncbi:hypothetical protein V8J88_10040 [Massilia sp. W12]|uniref:hypothetical protein n=1 Tax=Massilia sp. W12 TaxID=3126507 RepID=UPI0030CED8CC